MILGFSKIITMFTILVCAYASPTGFWKAAEHALRDEFEPHGARGPTAVLGKWSSDEATPLWRRWISPWDAAPELQVLFNLGLTNHGDDRRLLTVARRLLANQTVHIQFVGGSVTAGGLFGAHGWVKLVNHWLQSAFPGAQVHIESLGASGATVEFSGRCAAYKSGTHRVPHLVVIEHAINSAVDLKTANMELMFRHYLRLPTAPAVLVLNWMQTRCGQGSIPYPIGALAPVRPLRFDTSTHDSKLDVLTRYYSLPAYNYKAALWEVMERNSSFCNSSETQFFTHLTDGRHPNKVGHTLMASVVIELLRRHISKAADIGTKWDQMLQDGVGGSATPPPLIASEHAAALEDEAMERRKCFTGDSLPSLLLQESNFPWVVERTARGDARPGYISSHTGAFVDFDITGSQSVSVAYLQSYSNVGTATLSCGAALKGVAANEQLHPGCSCGVNRINALMPHTDVSIPIMRDLKVHIQKVEWRAMDSGNGSASCVLRVRATGGSVSKTRKSTTAADKKAERKAVGSAVPTTSSSKFKVIALLLERADVFGWQLQSGKAWLHSAPRHHMKAWRGDRA